MLSRPDLLHFDAVVFDMDGTLIDSEGHYCNAYIHCMSMLGGSLEEEDYYQRFAGLTDDAIDLQLQTDLPGVVELATIRETWRREYDRLRKTHGVPIMPGVEGLLDVLADHCLPLGVASSAGLPEIVSNLERSGLRDRFHSLSSGTEVPLPKPAPDVFLLAAERLEVDPTRCLAFEDTNAGTRAAIAAGMHTVMVAHRCDADDFARRHALEIVSSLRQILEGLQT